jgi:hypothetical protein
MTEDRWLTCDEPRKLLDHVEVYLKAARTKVGRRKVCLFACAYYRRFLTFLRREPGVHRVTDLAERYAEGSIGREEASALLEEILKAQEWTNWWYRRAAESLLARRPQETAAASLELPLGFGCYWDERRAQADLVREIWGNPFRPVSVPAAWLKWNDGVVPSLARSIYDERAFDRLPVLADALEDAGCRNEHLLGHLRSPGPHVRGCWALDRLLGLG